MFKLINSVILIVAIHTILFVGEYIYQQNCAKISFYGYFNMFFTNQSIMCNSLRNANSSLQQLMSNVIVQIGTVIYVALEGYENIFQRSIT